MEATRPERRWDAAEVLYETGRRVQAASLCLRKHQISDQQICTCGRLPQRTLPVFGPRCEIVCDTCDLAMSLMRRVLAHMTTPDAGLEHLPAIGRVSMPAISRLLR